MTFMQMEILQKGATYCGDCAKCGATHYVHEWATWHNNDERDDMQAGALHCPQGCGGKIDPDTFQDCGRQYAGRYAAPGYMDCTDWQFDTNKRRLAKTLRDYYGDPK